MRIRATLAAAVLALSPFAALAQDKPAPAADATGMEALSGLLTPPPPLTQEQQARLPLAISLAEKVVPPGSLGSMMDGMLGGLLGPMLGDDEPSARAVISRRVGGLYEDRDMTKADASRIADLLDPAWRERETRTQAFTQQAIEPVVRQAVAELYAVHFSDAQLADIDAFFSTPSGAAYASQSYRMASDPRLTATMMTMMPQAMEQMGAIEAELDAAMADLPPQRNYADLSDNQKKLLAQWLGLAVQDLEYTLIDATP